MVNLDFSADSYTVTALWVVVLGGLAQNLSSYTADQAVVQRYMTTKDTSSAARSIWANGIMAALGALLFFFIGTGLYGFYHSHPELLNPAIKTDQVFPAFIAAELPVGIAGLIVAGIFAAAQSTVSTSMNSTATTLVTDFLRPFNRCADEEGYLQAAKKLTLGMGVLGTLAGLVFIDGGIRSDRPERQDDGSDNMLDPDAIAESYLQCHNQHRSAWSWEIELRPWQERF